MVTRHHRYVEHELIICFFQGVKVDFTTKNRFVVSYPADDIYLIAARDLMTLSEVDVGEIAVCKTVAL